MEVFFGKVITSTKKYLHSSNTFLTEVLDKVCSEVSLEALILIEFVLAFSTFGLLK